MMKNKRTDVKISVKQGRVPELVYATLITAAALILLAGTLIYNKYSKIFIAPVILTEWGTVDGGLATTTVGKDSIYHLSFSDNKVKQYEKMTGKKGYEYALKNRLIWAEESPKGYLLVMETGVNEISKIDKGKKIGSVKLEGIEEPSGFTVDTQGNIIAANARAKVLLKYDPDGILIAKTVNADNGDVRFLRETGRLFSDSKGFIYVMENGTVFLRVFDAQLKPVRKINIKISGPILCAAIDDKGYIYLNNSGESNVLIFSSEGELKGKFSKDFSGQFKIIYPGGIAGGKNNDNIYVNTYHTGVFRPVDFQQ